MDHRPLEGFVLAITPFNFTAIAGNLPLAPALMGNTVVWKPSPTQQLAAHCTMRLLEAAGLPPGVVNLVTGDGLAVSEVALTHRHLAGVHFTGSTATFQNLWSTVGSNLDALRRLPAAGRRDRRQGLRHRAPQRRPGRAGDRRWSGARSSTRGRSARPPPGRTCPARCGRAACATCSCRPTESIEYGDVTDLSVSAAR